MNPKSNNTRNANSLQGMPAFGTPQIKSWIEARARGEGMPSPLSAQEKSAYGDSNMPHPSKGNVRKHLGFGQVLKYWKVLGAIFIVPQMLGVPFFVMVMLAIFALGVNLDGRFGGFLFNLGEKQQSYKLEEKLALRESRRKISMAPKDKEPELLLGMSKPSPTKDLIDRSSASASDIAASLLTWVMVLLLVGFSALLIYTGSNPEIFEPVGFIRSPFAAIILGEIGMGICASLFLYMSTKGLRKPKV